MVSLDGRCSAQAEQRKKPVAVVHLPGACLSTETNLVPIRGVMRKEFDTGHTHTHTELKRCGPPGPRRFAHVTLGKNEKRSAWTCWVSGVKFNHRSTSSRYVILFEMRCRRQKNQDIASFACSRNTCDRSLHWHDRTTGEDLRARSIASGET